MRSSIRDAVAFDTEQGQLPLSRIPADEGEVVRALDHVHVAALVRRSATASLSAVQTAT